MAFKEGGWWWLNDDGYSTQHHYGYHLLYTLFFMHTDEGMMLCSWVGAFRRGSLGWIGLEKVGLGFLMDLYSLFLVVLFGLFLFLWHSSPFGRSFVGSPLSCVADNTVDYGFGGIQDVHAHQEIRSSVDWFWCVILVDCQFAGFIYISYLPFLDRRGKWDDCRRNHARNLLSINEPPLCVMFECVCLDHFHHHQHYFLSLSPYSFNVSYSSAWDNFSAVMSCWRRRSSASFANNASKASFSPGVIT